MYLIPYPPVKLTPYPDDTVIVFTGNSSDAILNKTEFETNNSTNWPDKNFLSLKFKSKQKLITFTFLSHHILGLYELIIHSSQCNIDNNCICISNILRVGNIKHIGLYIDQIV